MVEHVYRRAEAAALVEQLARDAVALFLNGCTPTRHTQEET